MKNLELLGCRAQDKVTGFSGVITSVCFDLVGCIQAAVTPPSLPDEKEQRHGRWFDVVRLEIGERVMPSAFNEKGEPAEDKGSSEKPEPRD